jgi:beta-lactamase class D
MTYVGPSFSLGNHRARFAVAGFGLATAISLALVAVRAAPTRTECFLLYELGVGQISREPSSGCATRVTPASTFKIPHALAALDAGVLDGPDTRIAYDGAPVSFESWRHDHTLASAMHSSVVWYFQRVASMLGGEREREYLRKFAYGNQDPSSGLTTFWLGGSLRISPDEQQAFLLKLYQDALPVSARARETVRAILVQPQGRIVNASGTHDFGGAWPAGTVVSAKTGSGSDASGTSTRWIVGHVRRGARTWVFVSSLTGKDLTPLAAVDLAAQALHQQGVI